MAHAAPYFPGQEVATLYAMAGDDCSLHFDLNDLTEKQRADHASNLDLTALLQVALTGIGKPVDHVAMFDAFASEPWQGALACYRQMFTRLGLDGVPAARCHFHPRSGFYESVAADLCAVDLVTLYMVSGSNTPLHRDPRALTVSRAANSKMHFARHAPSFGIAVPQTLLTTKANLGDGAVAAFLDRHGGEAMLKTLGLAGARNVTAVSSADACADYVAQYPSDLEVLLQERLMAKDFTEMTVDLVVSDAAVEIANVRRILFADGLWVGNLLGGRVGLRKEQRDQLIRVGEYARAQGYHAPEGLNCGVDFFVGNPASAHRDELLVTEINARWTGGLFPAEVVKQLGLESHDVVAFFDLVARDRFDDYLGFVDKYLHRSSQNQTFGAVPLGFSPYATHIDGAEFLYVWQVVVGDLEGFKSARRAELSDDVLITVDKISLAL